MFWPGWVEKWIGKKSQMTGLKGWWLMGWMLVASTTGPVQEHVLYNIFISDMEGVTQCTLIRFAYSTKWRGTSRYAEDQC